MHTFTASEAKQNFGELLDSARQHPVRIEKQGRPFVVVISQETFEALEDAYWSLMAKKASKEGFLGVEKSEEFLKRMRERNLKDNEEVKSK